MTELGFDCMFTNNWGLNLKYKQMETDLAAGGTKLGKLDLKPIAAGVGVSYRF